MIKLVQRTSIQIDHVIVDEIMIEENGIQPFEVDNVQPSSERLMKGVEINPTPFFSLEVRLFLLIMINWITQQDTWRGKPQNNVKNDLVINGLWPKKWNMHHSVFWRTPKCQKKLMSGNGKHGKMPCKINTKSSWPTIFEPWCFFSKLRK